MIVTSSLRQSPGKEPNETSSSRENSGTSRAVQWLGLCAFKAGRGAWVPSVVEELRSHMLQCGQKREREKKFR